MHSTKASHSCWQQLQVLLINNRKNSELLDILAQLSMICLAQQIYLQPLNLHADFSSHVSQNGIKQQWDISTAGLLELGLQQAEDHLLHKQLQLHRSDYT